MTENRNLTIRQQSDELFVNIMPEIVAGLPSSVPSDRFQAAFMTAAANNPSIFQCDRKSIQVALLKCAADGLVPDGRQAALVPYNVDGKKVCQYIPMVQGIMKRARELGDITRISAHCVHEADAFVWIQGDDEKIEHRPPTLGSPRGAIIGAYAIFYDGGSVVHREVMDKAALAKVRAVSRAKDKVWGPWEEEMSRKSVIRRGAKYVPMSDALRQIITRDDDLVDLSIDPRGDRPHPALARAASTRAVHGRDVGAAISGHVEAETAALDRRMAAEDAEFTEATEPAATEHPGDSFDRSGDAAVGGEDGNQADEDNLSPEPIDADMMERFSAALMRASSKTGLKSYSGDFWSKNGGPPEKDGRVHAVAGRIWNQHLVRIEGGLDIEGCRAAIDQILGKVM